MASSSTRPQTSKPRGICRYYNVPRGCFAGNNCKFLHGEPSADSKPEDPPLLTPYDQSKRCRYYEQGFCKRGDACWFVHALPPSKITTTADVEAEDELCSVCFEKPTTYGLLSGCSHVFCITCIKQWRDRHNKNGTLMASSNTKKCPMCRAPSRFITPSSQFWKDGTQEKNTITEAYKDSMARVPCRYFQKSLRRNKEQPLCPYGKDCFYKHENDDGTLYVFEEGVDVCMRRYSDRMYGGAVFSFDDLRYTPFEIPFATRNVDVVVHNYLHGEDDNGDEENPAIRRFREVGRSLEILNEAIGDGSSLADLDQAVEALRAGLGRLGIVNPGEAGEARRLHGRNGTDDDTVMERLEILADQMLASIGALRRTGETQVLRTDTPPPPLEPIEEGQAGLSRSLSEDSLPGLQSVSGSSSENDGNDDEDGVERYMPPSDALNMAGLPWNELFDGWSSSQMLNAAGPATRDEEAAREAESSASAGQAMTLPALESQETVGQEEGTAGGVADGGGRAVRSEEDKRDGEEFTTDGRGRVISVGGDGNGERSGTGTGTGAGAGTGRSILDWFSGLF